MQKIRYLIAIIWELPQYLVGQVLRLFYYKSSIDVFWFRDVRIIISSRIKGGISLGKVIILREKYTTTELIHELGHSKQSKILGPLYLLVIGLPSLLHSIYYIASRRRPLYYRFYTEKWADRLMRIKR